MRAAKIYGTKDIRVEETAIPPLEAGKILLKVDYAGICGSDMHEYVAGTFPIRTQPVLGHEFSGTVVEVGEGVTTVEPGDQVAVEPLIACGHCSNCRRGMVNLCSNSGGYGYSISGGFADYAVVKEENAFKLPAEMDVKLGALVEPTAVAVHAVRQSTLRLGDTAAIFGAGPIGLLLLQAVKAAGASEIIVVEVSDDRREKALELGATHVLNPVEVDAVARIKELTDGGVDVAFDAAGVQATFLSGVSAVRRGGEFKVVSLWEQPVTFSPNSFVKTEAKITGSYAYANLFPEVIRLLAGGIIDGNKVITSLIPLGDIVEKGFETLTNDRKQCKILVDMHLS
ncbi:2,3-butanediol dehydrogenase [Paenibacillus sp. FSL W7-1332]|uniref:2,3-butanediol dehydrogenase n=1 Tax=Paenibacillus sp. FSL W7-1332 TaxID=2921702 RepID=UPI0030CE7282